MHTTAPTKCTYIGNRHVNKPTGTVTILFTRRQQALQRSVSDSRPTEKVASFLRRKAPCRVTDSYGSATVLVPTVPYPPQYHAPHSTHTHVLMMKEACFCKMSVHTYQTTCHHSNINIHCCVALKTPSCDNNWQQQVYLSAATQYALLYSLFHSSCLVTGTHTHTDTLTIWQWSTVFMVVIFTWWSSVKWTSYKKRILLCAAVDTVSHQHWSEAYIVCGRSGHMMKSDKAVLNWCTLN